jgi:carbamoyl-phosphate synthase small subunit
LAEQLAGGKQLVGRDIVQEITTHESYAWPMDGQDDQSDRNRHRVAVYDFGVKFSILRALYDHGCKLRIFPAHTPPDEILAWKPEGIFFSNGPGDPEPVTYAVAAARYLLGRIPIFGICLGHQILSLAMGAKTTKLKFGHHGANHPVKNLQTGAVEITSQNHGFNVEIESLPPDEV